MTLFTISFSDDATFVIYADQESKDAWAADPVQNEQKL